MNKFKNFLLATVALAFSLVSATPTFADGAPVMTLGTSLTTSQKQGTIDTLSSQISGQNYQTVTITGSDLVKYLNPSGSTFTTGSGVWSSALVQKTNSGSGINVQILP